MAILLFPAANGYATPIPNDESVEPETTSDVDPQQTANDVGLIVATVTDRETKKALPGINIQVRESKNQLWHFEQNGNELQCIDLKELDPSDLAVHPKTHDVWIAGRHSLARIRKGQTEVTTFKQKAYYVEICSSGQIWISTPDSILKLDDDGNEKLKFPMKPESTISVLAL